MMTLVHDKIERCDLFILFTPVGREIGEYQRAKDCANAIVVHWAPERLMVRGLERGKEVFRMPAEDFSMTIFD